MKTRTRSSSRHLIRFANADVMRLFAPTAPKAPNLENLGRNLAERIAAQRVEERKAR